MSEESATDEVLDSLVGKSIEAWNRGESDGMHFTLNDGRVIIILGFLAVYYPDAKVH